MYRSRVYCLGGVLCWADGQEKNAFPKELPQSCINALCLEALTYGLHCSSFFGMAKCILRIPKGNPKKELQWRLEV